MAARAKLSAPSAADVHLTPTSPQASPNRHAPVSSNISLATRLALVELLTTGSVPDSASALSPTSTSPKSTLPNSGPSIVARSQDAHARLHESIERHRPIVQFVQQYRSNQPYLLPQSSSPAAILQQHPSDDPDDEGASTIPPSSSVLQETVTPQSKIALLFDAESDIKQLERDLRMCDTYAHRDVAGAGTLAELQGLQPRLDTLKQQLVETLTNDRNIEQSALTLMERYQAHIDTLSQLFIHWDTMLTDVEDTLGRMERRR